MDIGGGHSSEEDLRRRPGIEVVAFDRHRRAGRCARRGGGHDLDHVGCGGGRRRGQGARCHRIDVGVGRVHLVGEELGVLTGGRVGVAHLGRLRAVGGPWPQNVVPVTPALGVARRGAFDVGPAVAIVVHPGEVSPERRVVQCEVRSPSVDGVGAQWGGVGIAHRPDQRLRIEGCIEARELREPAVTALLVGDDQLLHGHRVGGVLAREDHGAEAFERTGVIDVVQHGIDTARTRVVNGAERAVGHDLRWHVHRGFRRRHNASRACRYRRGGHDDHRGCQSGHERECGAQQRTRRGTRAGVVPSPHPFAPSCPGMDQRAQRTIATAPLRGVAG